MEMLHNLVNSKIFRARISVGPDFCYTYSIEFPNVNLVHCQKVTSTTAAAAAATTMRLAAVTGMEKASSTPRTTYTTSTGSADRIQSRTGMSSSAIRIAYK